MAERYEDRGDRNLGDAVRREPPSQDVPDRRDNRRPQDGGELRQCGLPAVVEGVPLGVHGVGVLGLAKREFRDAISLNQFWKLGQLHFIDELVPFKMLASKLRAVTRTAARPMSSAVTGIQAREIIDRCGSRLAFLLPFLWPKASITYPPLGKAMTCCLTPVVLGSPVADLI